MDPTRVGALRGCLRLLLLRPLLRPLLPLLRLLLLLLRLELSLLRRLLRLLCLLRLLLLLLRLLPAQQLALDHGERRRHVLDVALLVPLRRGRGALLELLGELADVRGAAREDVELLDAGVFVLVLS